MDLKKLIDGVIDVAEKFEPLLAGTPAGPIIEAGKAVVDLVQKAKDVASEPDQAKLRERLDVLEPRVLAHLDRTIESLD